MTYDFDRLKPILANGTGGVIYGRTESGIKSPEDLINRSDPLTFGGISATGLDLTTLVVFDLLDADVESIFGFEGRGPVNLALQRGEVDLDYQTTSAYGASVEGLVEDGDAVPLMAFGQLDDSGNVVRDPNFPDIPTVAEVYQTLHGKAPSGEKFEAYKTLLGLTYTYQKAMWVPHDTPPEAVKLLRESAAELAASPEFVESAAEVLGGYPLLAGEHLEELIGEAYTVDENVRNYVVEPARDQIPDQAELGEPIMLESALTALQALVQPQQLILLLVGVLAGLVIGLIPGLGGTGAVAILLPVTFGMEPEQALALLIGALAVVHTSDTVAAVLLGAPGSASASVTMLDGYSMAKQGQAARALSLAFLSSMAGGILGALGLTVAIPLARPLVLSFGSPELFMLTVLGVSLAAVLSRGNVAKGLTAGLLGLLFGMVGTSPTTAENRFTFGSLFLSDGLSLVAVALGVFGLAEIAARVGQRDKPGEVVKLGAAGSTESRSGSPTGHTSCGERPSASGPVFCPASARPPAPGWPTGRPSPPRRTSASSARVTPAASSAPRPPTTPSRPAI